MWGPAERTTIVHTKGEKGGPRTLGGPPLLVLLYLDLQAPSGMGGLVQSAAIVMEAEEAMGGMEVGEEMLILEEEVVLPMLSPLPQCTRMIKVCTTLR